jgi:hypothetical protein
MEPKTCSLLDGALPVAEISTQLGDPLLILIENGSALGVLFAGSCYQEGFGGRLWLDQVTWARGDESARTLRDFPEVCVSRSEQGF